MFEVQWGTHVKKVPFLVSTVIYTNLGFNQKCAISKNKVEAPPFKNGSWWCCMDPYSNPRKWQPLGSPLPKYDTAASILSWWLKTESSYQHQWIGWQSAEGCTSGISPFQFSGLECPNSHYLGKVVLVVALVWSWQSLISYTTLQTMEFLTFIGVFMTWGVIARDFFIVLHNGNK